MILLNIDNYLILIDYNSEKLKFRCSKKHATAVKRNLIKRRIRHIMRILNIQGLKFYIQSESIKDKKNIEKILSFNMLENCIKQYLHCICN